MIINGVNVTTWAQAAAVEALVAANSFGPAKSESRYQTNGQLESFYVHKLMSATRNGLGKEITDGKAAVGANSKDNRKTFQRALKRVQAARGKNPAFRNGR